jgi:hypothetical protein
MKTYNLIKKWSLKAVLSLTMALALTLTGFAQEFSSGGYQGGTHGNIKVITWSGALDNDWSKPGNWCPAAVPGAQDDVVIPAAPSIMPEVKTSGLSCKNVTLQPGATLTIKPGYVLTVNGQNVE